MGIVEKTVADVGEAGLLRGIARRLSRPGPGVVLSVGDDAALLKSVGPNAVLTADMLVEGVDFELAWASFADVGHKAAAANLSDLAGMGAKPRALLLSLGLRPELRAKDVLSLISAMDAVGRRFGAPLVGGDLSRTRGPMVVAVTAVGEASRPLLRGRGRPGDVIMVSGELGGAAAGLARLMAGEKQLATLARRQLRPTPRVALGQALARAGVVRSAADISDGLASDALHLCMSGCTVRLDAARLPLGRGVDDVRLALTGGEDFELALAVAPERAQAAGRIGARLGVPLTAVGEVVRGRRPQITGLPPGTPKLRGFDHFRR